MRKASAKSIKFIDNTKGCVNGSETSLIGIVLLQKEDFDGRCYVRKVKLERIVEN